jgi:hypothetical protein
MASRHPVPKELKLEHYERRKQAATLDNLLLTVELIPGRDGIGAIVKNFVDGINNHDVACKKYEEQWDNLVAIRRDFQKKNRLYRNLDGAWNTLMSDNAEDFAEYNILVPKMYDIEARIERVQDEKVKMQMQADYDRYLELDPYCSKLLQVQTHLNDSREARDEAQKDLLFNEQELTRMRSEEKTLASKITDDHVVANEQGKAIGHIFPNIQSNNVLFSIGSVHTEDMPYNQVILEIKKAQPPHKCIFRRYDYRFDLFRHVWYSLQELRESGVTIDDPMMAKAELVRLASVGDFNAVKGFLLRGEDPNAQDYTGTTCMHAAAANNHPDIIELLHRAGADVNTRDKNMSSPLISAVTKGNLPIVRQLIEIGADRNVSDKNNRNVLYYAMISGNLKMVNFFCNTKNCNNPEALWGFTPMHTAANLGNLDLTKKLLTYGASIYKKEKQGRTPEDVARETGYLEQAEFLENERYSAPAQLAYSDHDNRVNIWIGEFAALDPHWTTDVGITEVVCLTTPGQKPENDLWLEDDEQCKHYVFEVDVNDEDESRGNWESFSKAVPAILKQLVALIKYGDCEILICDPRGNSTSPTLLAIALLMKYQNKITESLARFAIARPSMEINKALRIGLEEVQTTFDKKKLAKLDDKMRHAVIISAAF